MKKSKKSPAARQKAAKRSKSQSGTFRRGGAEAGIAPLGDRVLVKPLSPEEAGKTTSFGIIIPETIDKEKPEQGRVVAVGPGKRAEGGTLVPVGVKVGDKIVFSKYGYDEVKKGGVEYYLVREDNILAVIN